MGQLWPQVTYIYYKHSIQQIIINIVFSDKTIKLWKVSERRYRLDGFNLYDEYGAQRDLRSINTLRSPHLVPVNELTVEATPKK